uniref:Caspase family p20 domain-containing protein n=1 Tax=Myripristis murdjan TaxID=586833 RepID=A0A667X3E7_9TELE
ISALQHCCLLNNLFWQVYPVDKKSFRSRLALLIVNRDFDDPDMTRYGAEKDEQNMEHLLKELGYKDSSAVKEFSQLQGLSQTDSVFVVIMSHGNFGNNPDEFCIENIYKHLNSENCPVLVNKPKVVIIQACRGSDPLTFIIQTPKRSSTPNSLIHVFMDLALCTGAQSCWNRKGHLQTVPTKLGARNCPKCLCMLKH